LFSIIIFTSCNTKEPTNEITTHCTCFERDLPTSENPWENPTDWEVTDK